MACHTNSRWNRRDSQGQKDHAQQPRRNYLVSEVGEWLGPPLTFALCRDNLRVRRTCICGDREISEEERGACIKNSYTSAFWMQDIAMANLWSSPPERLTTSRSSTWFNSRSSQIFSLLSFSNFESSICDTFRLPLIAFGMWSTYWGLMSAFRLSSKTFVK